MSFIIYSNFINSDFFYKKFFLFHTKKNLNFQVEVDERIIQTFQKESYFDDLLACVAYTSIILNLKVIFHIICFF